MSQCEAYKPEEDNAAAGAILAHGLAAARAAGRLDTLHSFTSNAWDANVPAVLQVGEGEEREFAKCLCGATDTQLWRRCCCEDDSGAMVQSSHTQCAWCSQGFCQHSQG